MRSVSVLPACLLCSHALSDVDIACVVEGMGVFVTGPCVPPGGLVRSAGRRGRQGWRLLHHPSRCQPPQVPLRSCAAGVTEVDLAWLTDVAPPLMALSAPLEEPAPRYVPARDAVLAWHGAAFGRHGWALPPVARPVADAGARAALFAAALLAGRVLPSLSGARSPCWQPRSRVQG